MLVLCGLGREQGTILPWQSSWQQAGHQAGKVQAQTFCPSLCLLLSAAFLCKAGSFPGADTSYSEQEH